MTTEVTITLDIDLSQENGKRCLRSMERHLVEHGFTQHQSLVDEDWGCVSYKTDKGMGDVRGIQNHLLNQAQNANVRVSSEIREFTPMIIMNAKENHYNSHIEFFEKFGKINVGADVVEFSFATTTERNEALQVISNEGFHASSYFNEIILETTNNFTAKSSKKSTFR